MLHVVIQLSYSDNGNDWAKKNDVFGLCQLCGL